MWPGSERASTRIPLSSCVESTHETSVAGCHANAYVASKRHAALHAVCVLTESASGIKMRPFVSWSDEDRNDAPLRSQARADRSNATVSFASHCVSTRHTPQESTERAPCSVTQSSPWDVATAAVCRVDTP
ncbi:hypothetical protein PUN4_280016 [Paraburkholderia unamae]|nr:hypothetical protein PUN4_280016 [Paraburkholderia unamae]